MGTDLDRLFAAAIDTSGSLGAFTADADRQEVREARDHWRTRAAEDPMARSRRARAGPSMTDVMDGPCTSGRKPMIGDTL